MVTNNSSPRYSQIAPETIAAGSSTNQNHQRMLLAAPVTEFCQRARWSPTAVDSALQSVIADPGSLCPFGQRQSLAEVRQSMRRALVVCLRAAISPSTIPRGVWAIIINTIERVAVRAWPHVGQKCIEAGAPAIAHGDSTASVKTIRGLFSVVTASLSAIPRGIRSCAALPVSGSLGCPAFALPASTAFSIPGAQMLSGHDLYRSTITPTSPERSAFSLVSRRAFNNAQAPKAMAGDVDSDRLHRFVFRRKDAV